MDENTPLRRQLLSIPNMLSYFRIILIPFIVWKYVAGEYYTAVFLVILSGLSDALDGIVARKYNMITPVGKLIDPVADKLTQFALVLAISFRFRFMFVMLAVFVVKEIYMMVMNVLLYRKNKTLHGAVMCGKICTSVLYVVMGLLILIPQMPHTIANILIAVGIAFLIYAFAGYGRLYVKMWNE